MNDLKFGTLGSLCFGGLTLGSAVASAAFSKSKYNKYTLIISLVLNAGFIYAFTLPLNFAFLSAMRFLIGFCQIFDTIFMPVWADSFASGEA
jgi:hypothetical protein